MTDGPSATPEPAATDPANDTLVESSAASGPPTQPGAVDLGDLYIRPTRFFSSEYPFSPTGALPVVAWAAGINWMLARVEQRMVRADLGRADAPTALGDSWVMFWLHVTLYGIVAGFMLWHLGTWWYRVRLNWAGAIDPDVHRSRVVYLYSALVWALPAIVWQVVDTVHYPSYASYWNDDSWLPTLMLIPGLWSFVVSYRGVRAAFTVEKGIALFWFLIAPAGLLLAATTVTWLAYAGVL